MLLTFNNNGRENGQDRTNGVFSIEVITVDRPVKDELLAQGTPFEIKWHMNGTQSQISPVKINDSKNGGTPGNLITTLTGLEYLEPGDHTFLWGVPVVNKPKNRCKVKIKLLNDRGDMVGKNVSKDYFKTD